MCGGPIGTVGTRGQPGYKCQKNGCLRIEKPAVDEIVRDMILAFLKRPDTHAMFTPKKSSAEAREATAKLSRLRAELDEARNARPATLAETRCSPG